MAGEDLDVLKALAREAALFGDGLTRRLLLASTEAADLAEVNDQLTRAFAAWPALGYRIATLQAAAPREADDGLGLAILLREVASGFRC